MDIKKGNKGNKYLQEILKILGPEYSSNDDDIITNNMHKFKILHKTCGKVSEINYAAAKKGTKCRYCFSHGQHQSDEYFEKYVKEKYNGEFTFVKQEVRNKKHRFLYVKHTCRK